jgi:hypothetical protein
MDVLSKLAEVQAEIVAVKARLAKAEANGLPINDPGVVELQRTLNRLYDKEARLESPTPGAMTAGSIDIVEEIKEVRKEMHNIVFGLHTMIEKIPRIEDVGVTPSEHCKSSKGEVFFDIMGLLGFEQDPLKSLVREYCFETTSNPECMDRRISLDFKFVWVKSGKKCEEAESYSPVQEHLSSKGIVAGIVGNGENLPDGLLYRSKIHTLKPNLRISSLELKKKGEHPIWRYTVRGRTDLVVKYNVNRGYGQFNNKYLIEIKTVDDFKEETALREAFLQLLGTNASNSFHSPSVILTNLATKHFVLYISMEGDPQERLQFKLNILKMVTFGDAIFFAEELSQRPSITSCFCRASSAVSSPLDGTPEKGNPIDDDAELATKFGCVEIDEPDIDDEKEDCDGSVSAVESVNEYDA